MCYECAAGRAGSERTKHGRRIEAKFVKGLVKTHELPTLVASQQSCRWPLSSCCGSPVAGVSEVSIQILDLVDTVVVARTKVLRTWSDHTRSPTRWAIRRGIGTWMRVGCGS